MLGMNELLRKCKNMACMRFPRSELRNAGVKHNGVMNAAGPPESDVCSGQNGCDLRAGDAG